MQTDFTQDQVNERRANRTLKTSVVVDRIREQFPEVIPFTEIVGFWVWITFSEKPAPHVLVGLKLLGFSYNSKRRCWQHACGMFRPSAPYNPKSKYVVSRLEEVQ